MKEFYVATRHADFMQMIDGELVEVESPFENAGDAVGGDMTGLLCWEGEHLTGPEGDAACLASGVGKTLEDAGWTFFAKGEFRKATAAEAVEIGLVLP